MAERSEKRWLLNSAAAFAVALLTGTLGVNHAVAQGNESGWSLQDLVGVALDRNPGLAATRAATAAALEDITAAKGQRLPQLEAVGNGAYFPRRERLLIFRHGFRKADNPFENAIVDYGVRVSLPLFTNGRIDHEILLSEAKAKAARFRTELTRNELIFNVASGYYTALRLQRVIAAQQATLESLNESRRISRLQQDVGRIAPLDILRLQTRVSQGERDLAGAQNAYAQTIEVLKELINVPTELSLDVKGALSPSSTEIAEEIEAMRDGALAQRPDLISLRHEVRSKKEAVGIADARLGPTASFNANYRGVTGIDDGTTLDDGGLFLKFRMPLYSGGILRANRRKALAKLREAELRLRDAERRALGQLERAGLDLKSSVPRIRAARRAVSQAGESRRVEREKFTLGRGTSNDLLIAEEALLRARTELAIALADSQIAGAALNLAAGETPVPVEGETVKSWRPRK
jgi:outer membrane protein